MPLSKLGDGTVCTLHWTVHEIVVFLSPTTKNKKSPQKECYINSVPEVKKTHGVLSTATVWDLGQGLLSLSCLGRIWIKEKVGCNDISILSREIDLF